MTERQRTHFLQAREVRSQRDMEKLIQEALEAGLRGLPEEYVVNGERQAENFGPGEFYRLLRRELAMDRAAACGVRNRMEPSGRFSEKYTVLLQTGPGAAEKLNQSIIQAELDEESLASEEDQNQAQRAGAAL